MRQLVIILALAGALSAQSITTVTGSGSVKGVAQAGASVTFPTPLFFRAYTGEILVNPPSAYSFGSTTKNGSTTTDTTYPSGTPATIFRCTDVNMTPGKPTSPGYNAGEGGSGASDLISIDDYALRLEGSSGYSFITLFNPLTLTCGDPTTGNVITQDKNVASPGSSSLVESFGGGTFSQTQPGVFTAGGQTTRSTSLTQVTQYTINTHSGATSTWGNFTWSPIADMLYALPINSAVWTSGITYAFGATVTYALTSGQLTTYPTPPATITPNVGDLIQPVAGCAFKAIKVTGPTNGSTPNWNSVCSGSQLGSIVDGGVTWKGIGGAAVFVFQNTGTSGQSGGSGTPAFVPASGHPTLLTTASDSNGIVWTNICPAVSPTWQSWGGSGLNDIVPNEAFSTCTYGTHQSQNITNITISSGTATIHWAATSFLTTGPATISGNSVPACNGNVILLTAGGTTATFTAGSCTASTGGLAVGDVFTTNGDQGTGIFAVEWDGNVGTNIYHTFNTATLIQTDNTCTGGGTGGFCAGGTLVSSWHGPMTGTTCNAFIHNVKSRYGRYVVVAKQGTLGTGACGSGSYIWRAQQSPFVASSQVSELPFQPNHWDDMYANFFSQTSAAGYPTNTSGYGQFAVQEPLGTLPFASPPPAVWANFPCSTGSAPYTSTPPCQAATYVDSHLSCAYNPFLTDTYPCMGTMYNLLTLDINPFMAWQGEEIAVSNSPATLYSAFPISAGFGTVWRFGHTNNWMTSQSFSGQFSISEVAPSGNFIFFTSDDQGTFGSTTGSAPTVCSGACTNGQLAVTAVPASPSCVGGPVWEPNHAYVVGNVIVPVGAGNAGSGGTLDIFQAVTVTGNSGSSQPAGFTTASFTTPTPTTVTDGGVTWQDIYTSPGPNGGSLCRNEVLGMKLPH